MPEHEIPTLDAILNEPIVEKRINSLIAIAYTNYNSINDINEKIEEICGKNNGVRKLERGGWWAGVGIALSAFAISIFEWISRRNGN